MENMQIYEATRSVPEGAKKPINNGRLKGKTDINPMWRIKTLTEQFGPCGIGWKPVITEKSIIDGANGEKVAIVDMDLFIKVNGEWSEPIHGTGGSMLVANERNGLYTSDEAYKMAYTDAISVCCKLLGFGADVYWNADTTKYTAAREPGEQQFVCSDCKRRMTDHTYPDGQVWSPAMQAKFSIENYGRCLCSDCIEAQRQKAARQ